MEEAELQLAINAFEDRAEDGSSAETVRAEVRSLLFQYADIPVKGSIGDVVNDLASQIRPPAGAAALVLRALAKEGVLQDNTANNLARNLVSLVEKGLPGLYDFLGTGKKSQTYERLEVLRGTMAWVESQLAPLAVPYGTLDSMLAARSTAVSALSHGRLQEFGSVYHLSEIKDAVEAVFAGLDHVSKISSTLAADVESCERSIVDAQRLAATYPSFATSRYLQPWLKCALMCLHEFIESLRGRFTASIVQDWSGDVLLKRYPLLEGGRTLRVLVPFDSESRGAAMDVQATMSTDSDHVLLVNEQVSLGNVSPGKFSIAFDLHVVDPCTSVVVMLDIAWGEVGTAVRQTALFEVEILAQEAGIDWEAYAYADPYGTAPAEADEFVGRHEQVQILVSRVLRKPMEPSYITGQKRVGKTSLAKAAAEQARLKDPKGKLSWHYILWGEVAHEDPRVSLRQLGEHIEEFIIGELPGSAALPHASYDGSLSALMKLSAAARIVDLDRRFVIIIDEFDEMPQELYLQGNLAETVFANIRALTTSSNMCLILVGGENMPFVMDRQGQKLNKFSRVNLTYFDRATEWDDYERLIREPSSKFLKWHADAIGEVYDLTNGNPYFSKIICSKVYAKALRERDVDITREEVRNAVGSEISRFDDNLFAHLWQDGIFTPVDEREPIVLKRKRVLAALARCIRAGAPATLANIHAHKSSADLTEAELASVLADFVGREVLVERVEVFHAVLPIFELWLTDVGLTRLAADTLSQDLAAAAQQAEDQARVLSEELVALTTKWPTYRGRHVGPEEVRAWLNQRTGNRDQRCLFSILKAIRFISEADILERIRNARLTVLGLIDVAVRRKVTDRRNDIVITYVDGEGKSGQRYASLYAEENFVSTKAILPPTGFQQAFEAHVEQHGAPKIIVIIDDLVGTGRSLATNMKKFHDDNLALLQSAQPLLLAFALLATKEGQQSVLSAFSGMEYPRLDFRAGEILGDDAYLFAGAKGSFATVEERDRAKAISSDIGATIYRNSPLGYGGQALGIVLPTTVPNNSLPLLHSRGKGSSAWRPIFERLVN